MTTTKTEETNGEKARKSLSQSDRMDNLERAVLMLLEPAAMMREEHVVAIRKLVTTGETPEETEQARADAIAAHEAGE